MEQITLDMIPNGYTPIAHVSQYDNGRHIRFNLRNITLDGSESVLMKIRKSDGNSVSKTIENHTSYLEYVSEMADCDVAGTANCEIVISKDNAVLGSKNFRMNIEADAYDGAGVVTETASGSIATFETNMVDELQEVKCEINAKQDLHGEDKPYPAGGGVNIWDEEWENGGISESDGSTFTNPNTIRSKNYIPCTPNTNFYYYCGSGDLAFRICYYDSNKNFISCEVIVPINRVYQTPANCAFIKIGMRDTYGTTYKNDISINNPSTDHDYHPYENVCPIIGIDELNIQRTGNNINSGLSEVTIPSSSSSISPAITRVYLKAGQTYTFSCYQDNDMSSNTRNTMRLNKVGDMSITYYENTLPNYHLNKGLHTFTVTIQESGEYDLIFWGHSLSDTTLYNEFQIEFGSTATPYHSYSGKLIKLEFDDTVYLAEVSCLNNVWKLRLLGAEYVVDSISQIYRNTGNSWYVNPANGQHSATAQETVISDKFAKGQTQNENVCFMHPNGLIRFNTAKSYDTASDLLADIGMFTFVYPLETPTEITLDETEQFEALIGINNVWHDGNGNTEVKYLYDA